MCGEYGEGLYIYYGTESGSVSGGGRIKDSNGSEIFGIDRFTGPAIADLDGDGLKDLLVACSVDSVYVNGYDSPGPLKYYKNTGAIGNPEYTYQGPMTDKNGDVIEHVYLRVCLADMDNDGLVDIVTSNTRDKNVAGDTSNVFMYRNIGTTTNPIFDEGVILTLENGDKIPSNYAIRLGVGDIDNDGIQDLIINASTHYPGKASIYLGVLKQTANGETKYSLKKSDVTLSFDGSVIKIEGMTGLKVFNASGRKVAEKRSGEVFDIIKMNELNLTKGVHLLEVEKGNQVVKSKIIGK